MQTKVCTKCQVEQPLENFQKDPRYKGGHTTWCYRCRTQRQRERRSENIERERAMERRRRETNKEGAKESVRRWRDKNLDYLREAQKAWRENNPGYMAEKAREYRKRNPVIGKAHGYVKRAIKAGALPPVATRTCQICNKQAEHYHHWSYLEEHWLDVVPLCRICHRRLHSSRLQSSIPVPTQ